MLYQWDVSLSSSSLIQSNMSSIVRAKMKMSMRNSNRVTNCWSPKHCSIKWQKLEPTFESLNGIWMSSYKSVELALNAVSFMLLSSITSWRYPCTRSNEENQLLLWTAYRASSILKKWKGISYHDQIKFLVIYAQMNFPCLFLHNNYLGCIRTLRWPNNALPQPGIQTLMHFPL